MSRDEIALEMMTALMGSPLFEELIADTNGEDEAWEALAHNVAVDAFKFADAFIAVSNEGKEGFES